MLDALLSHKSVSELTDVDFIFLFIEQDLARVEHLRQEITGLGDLPTNVAVHIEHGEFEDIFSTVIDPIIQKGAHLIPTFAFIDPFGYSSASMSITGRLLDFPRCEVLYFLPMSFIHRFVGREGQDAALTSLFGTDEWRSAIPLHGPERTAHLLALFERRLQQSGGVEYVRSFQLRTQDGNDYRLVFSLGHLKGLEIAKDAMWRVDPVTGTSYTATTESGQEVLFSPGEMVNTGPLLAELRTRFGTEWFSIDQADRCTLVDTPFRKAHLRRLTLQPAEKEGRLEVRRPGRGFKNAKMRFRS
jgi:three-Cys-motif partner protein